MDHFVGLWADLDFTVTPDDTALALGSGEVDVLGTPRALAMLEAASVAAVADDLAPDETSVGVRVELDHLLPSRIGDVVRANARLVRVSGRRLHFEVRLHDRDERVLAVGNLVRAVVERHRFG